MPRDGPGFSGHGKSGEGETDCMQDSSIFVPGFLSSLFSFFFFFFLREHGPVCVYCWLLVSYSVIIFVEYVLLGYCAFRFQENSSERGDQYYSSKCTVHVSSHVQYRYLIIKNQVLLPSGARPQSQQQLQTMSQGAGKLVESQNTNSINNNTSLSSTSSSAERDFDFKVFQG